jgi:hypothetical protein
MKDAVEDRLATHALRLDYHNFGTDLGPCGMHGMEPNSKKSQSPSLDAASEVVLRGKTSSLGPTSSQIVGSTQGPSRILRANRPYKLFSMNTLRISPTPRSGSPQEDSELCRPSRHVNLKTGNKTLSLSGHHNIHVTKIAQDDRPQYRRTVVCLYPNIIKIMSVKSRRLATFIVDGSESQFNLTGPSRTACGSPFPCQAEWRATEPGSQLESSHGGSAIANSA